ncbi:hypothetical protein TMatcc_009967 [Talaromyces marneffei ATCC 18224]
MQRVPPPKPRSGGFPNVLRHAIFVEKVGPATGHHPWKRPQDLKKLQFRLAEMIPGEAAMNRHLQNRVKILDTGRGLEMIITNNNGNKITKFIRRGVYACPSVDHFGTSIDLTMRRGMENLDQFIAIAEHEAAFASRIQTFLVQILHGNRPYVWQWWEESHGWKHLGADPSWVRAKKLIKFEQLKEVSVVIRGQMPLTVMTQDWRAWKVKQWREELLKLKSEWPARWRGVTPKLTFKKPDFTVLVADEPNPVAG